MTAIALAAVIVSLGPPGQATSASAVGSDVAAKYETRWLAKWEVRINRRLLDEQADATRTAIDLLLKQLREVEARVPARALVKLRQVTLWLSPEYPGTTPSAAYHPSATWLRENGRDPAMARSIEFTNVRIFESESRRMPNFALHELAHAYHHRYLPQGFDNPEIRAAYESAKASGTYDRVEKRDAEGRSSLDKAYGMTNAMEYFAESSEAYFSRNDFFPFDNAQLKAHDPRMYELVGKLWRQP